MITAINCRWRRYFADSSLIGYATLALFAGLALALYFPIVAPFKDARWHARNRRSCKSSARKLTFEVHTIPVIPCAGAESGRVKAAKFSTWLLQSPVNT